MEWRPFSAVRQNQVIEILRMRSKHFVVSKSKRRFIDTTCQAGCALKMIRRSCVVSLMRRRIILYYGA